ncbi:MAG: sigma-54-dependent Fis family transcriptional regulator [Thermoguttaceae bacterium]|nr:sigma-54-dependent Fis family transcriptional regulator [Thermoguttaceae bacterium]
MSSSISILFVDDDLQILRSTAEWLGSYGHSVRPARSKAEADSILKAEAIDLAFVDLRLGPESGMDVLRLIKESFPEIPVVMLSGLASIEDAMEAVKNGAADFLTKPLMDDKVLEIINSLNLKGQKEEKTPSLNGRASSAEVSNPILTPADLLEVQPSAPKLQGIIGSDSSLQGISEVVDRIADTRMTVLITGESGTGKSLLARAIHQASSRRDAPFVEVACGALPETLIESELFGHEAGAFTGAVSKKIGRFLQADGGTIFLDEIGTASPALQIKLLRVLQDFEFEPVGGTKTQRVNTRVILATNEDLTEAVASGRFRQDLFYRINVINLELPPLRRRVADIPRLAQFFLEKTRIECHRDVRGFRPETLALLQNYTWPGNVRELQNVVERVVLLGSSPWILPQDLPPHLREDFQESEAALELDFTGASGARNSLKNSLNVPERQIILNALEANQWSRNLTAESLGINRTTLYKKMKKFQLI